MSRSVLVVAGEVSGDMHAAAVIRELREKDADLTFFGIGGEELQKAGVELLYHVQDTAVFGFTEVIKRAGFFGKMLQRTIHEAEQRQPVAALLVDYGGFNLRLAKRIKRPGLKLLYFICPQVWATRSSRIQTMARLMDRLMVIFPFEKMLFNGTGLQVDFVGHPMIDNVQTALEEDMSDMPWPGYDTRLALLPGSRKQEVDVLLPLMCSAAARLERKGIPLACMVAAPNEPMAYHIDQRLYNDIQDKPSNMHIVFSITSKVLAQAQAAFVASGSATVEAALAGCPMVITYKAPWLVYWAARMMIQVGHIGMVNIISDREICPEFVQHHAKDANLAEAMEPLLTDSDERATMVEALAEVKKRLGKPGASRRVADIIHRELQPD